jgi:hypothetical protein
MIGAEALFLPVKDTEISYRFSLRVAHLVRIDGLTRRELFDKMRSAYKLRSTIVHGGAVSPEDAKIVDLVEEVLRSGLKEVIGRATKNPGVKSDALVDWDGLILDH